MITVVVVIALALLSAWFVMIHMPGKSFRGELPGLTAEEKSLAAELRGYVEKLAGEIGVRNTREYEKLAEAQRFVHQTLEGFGYRVNVQEYVVDERTCANLEVEIPGTTKQGEILVVGAHYDSVWGSPGADDNASAVAGLLALEMLGFYTDEKKSQHYPPPLGWFYPSTGDFIAFVGNIGSRSLVHQALGSFRRHTRFPSEGAAIFSSLPGIGYSDHWSFWQIDVPAIMVTDTAFFRNRHYHEMTDTPDKLDYERMARVVAGLKPVISDLLNAE